MLKNVRNGAVLDRTFRADEKMDVPSSTRRTCSSSTTRRRLRVHGHQTYEQLPVSAHSRSETSSKLSSRRGWRRCSYVRGRDHRRRPPRRRSTWSPPRPSRDIQGDRCFRPAQGGNARDRVRRAGPPLRQRRDRVNHAFRRVPVPLLANDREPVATRHECTETGTGYAYESELQVRPRPRCFRNSR